LVLAPAFLGCGGNIGGILAARLSTKLHLGLIGSGFVPTGGVLREFFVSIVLALLVFPFVGGVGFFFLEFFFGFSPGFYAMVLLSTLAGFSLVFFVTIATFLLSVFSYGRGWNPDNVLIPLVSSSADFLGIVVLIVFALWLNVA